ncbi:MAG: hypothetical protein FJ012_08720 [Chloroflexi bacterium]|nr:hypothetical protein [Chloroflexota bacterium]
MDRIVWNRTKCVSCRMCEAVCSFVHEGEFNPTKFRIKVVRTVDGGMLYSVSVFCLHCEEAFCRAACPVGAIAHDDRAAMIDKIAKKEGYGQVLADGILPVARRLGTSRAQREALEKMNTEYYELRGCDPITGAPTRAELEKLGLKNLADKLDKLDLKTAAVPHG